MEEAVSQICLNPLGWDTHLIGMVLMKGVGSGMVDLMTSDLIFAGQFTDDVYTATRTPTIFPYHAFPSNRRRQVRLAIAGRIWILGHAK